MTTLLMTGCIALAIPMLGFSLQCALSLLPLRRRCVTEAANIATVVIIPAHNEAAQIRATVRNALEQVNAKSRVLVVADNCTDETADIARLAGAEVIERTDERRGKGYALDHAVRQLEKSPPDVVVVLDADCSMAAATLDHLAARVVETGQPAQASNLTERTEKGGAMQAVAVLGNRVTNYVRPRGAAAIGMPCRLLGTGMALPWHVAAQATLATGDLVEDMRLSIDLLLAGHTVHFVPQAEVRSALPGDSDSFQTQRRRWEHGHLVAALTQTPRLLFAAVTRLRFRLFWAAWDLCIPPMALLVIAWMLGGATTLVAVWMQWASWAPLLVLAAAGGGLVVSLLTAWFVHCRRQVPASALISLPFYVLAKLPIYAGFLFKRQKTWVRTSRGSADAATNES